MSLIGYEELVFVSNILVSTVSAMLQVLEFELTGDNSESVVDSEDDDEEDEEHGVVEREDADRELFELSSSLISPSLESFCVKSLLNTSAPLKI